jgi:hypothetical protein
MWRKGVLKRDEKVRISTTHMDGYFWEWWYG